ncbi:hypothetical protein BJY52DRAFT_1187916 [Lactarius psammicola]|nr:hypothetical protein BJY52DRAFT_1187916 [Lactarius psammicola]
MGNCCSNTSTEPSSPPPPGSVPQQPPPNGQVSERQQGGSLPMSPQERHTIPGLVQPGESIAALKPPQPERETPQKPLHKSVGPILSPSPRALTKSSSVNLLYDSGNMGYSRVSNGETSQKPLPKSGRSNPSSSPHYMPRSVSATPYDSARYGPSAPDPRLAPRAVLKPAAPRGNNTGSFPSTVREILPDGFRFRILVLGKSQSGKSSLINAVFNVDMAVAPGSQHGNADINVGFSPSNNRYLVVHEYIGFGSGDAQSLQTIRDFISYRTDANRSVSKRLHAIWICVPMSDAIEKGLGEGVNEILGMKKVPVLIVFTKFDLLVSRVQFDMTHGDIQTHEQPRAKARAMYEDLCSSLFRKTPKDAPAVIFSEKRAYRDLIGELTSTTHGFIKADAYNSTGRPTSSQVQLPGPQITPALLAWSIAQRVNHDIIIQASIEHVLSSSFSKIITSSRSPGLGEVVSNICPGSNTEYIPTSSLAYVGYWRGLGSSQDFTDQALESCVKVIHEDIINVWNFDDRERYLLNRDFTARMSHIVGHLAGSPTISPDSYSNGIAMPMAQWMNAPYQNNHKNIRCIMAYIVDLTVILHGLFVSTRSVSATRVQSAVEDYAKNSPKSQIHNDIRSFVAQTPFTYQNRDTIMERIIDLIKQNCVRTSSQDSS